ncbi:hypothetical protein D3C72_1279510 [compost metagenome]|jgi:hypothetical protein
MHSLPFSSSSVALDPRTSGRSFRLPTPTKEADVLSPHEIAALLLIGDAQGIDDLEPDQLDGQKLVTIERGHARGHAYPRLTRQGQSMLEAVRSSR